MTKATAGRAPGRPKPARDPLGGSDDVPVGRGAPCPVDVVVHTHWDREWYLPREATLARLQAVMTEVLAQLDSGALPSFLFDGQTVALRDLLAVASPDMAARLQHHASAGRLVLGPWFVSADEFLVSGESLLRNLEFGHADAAVYATAQRVGYLPDTFGHVAQMPQVLAQFGITTAALWRGADAEHDRFDWHAPDGTVAATVFMTHGYYLHPLHGDDWATALPPLLQRIAARRAPASGHEAAGPLLLPHGGDHLAPHPQLAARLAQFNSAQNDFELRLSTLAQHVNAVLAAPGPRQALHRELRHNTQAFVLPDVLSTRRYLKLAHQQAEDRLLGETEPLWAQLSPHEPPPALQAAWRLLIEQQAHDSICGCSVDEVHAEMAHRFVQLGQQLDALRHSALVHAGMVNPHRHGATGPNVFADDSACTLFNPLPQARSGWWVATVFLHGVQHGGLKVSTDEGTELTYELLGVEAASELVSPLDDFPERLPGYRYELAVQAVLPGLGALALHIEGVELVSDTCARAPCTELENAAWHVALAADGSLQLTDRRNGRVISNALGLLSEMDVGDSYNFSPPTDGLATRAQRWWLHSAKRSAAAQEMKLLISMHLPASADPPRPGRRPEAAVLCHGTLRLRLLGDEPALHARLVWHNAARDQRTRLLLPWLDDTVHSTWSDTAFAFTERPVRLAQIPAEPSRQEMPVVVQPSLSTVVAGPLAVIHRALHEHEVMHIDGTQMLALTLVRSVGWLSRRDLRTRGVGAGPDLATPGAQCLGEQVADFQLLALLPGEPAHTALAAAANLRRPPRLLRGHSATWAAPVDIGNGVVQTSSVRRLADGRLELRLWNPTAESQPLALDADGWDVVYADGRPHTAAVNSVPPFAIHTLRQRGPAPAAAPA